jgi:hypothetical protein
MDFVNSIIMMKRAKETENVFNKLVESKVAQNPWICFLVFSIIDHILFHKFTFKFLSLELKGNNSFFPPVKLGMPI